MRIPAAERSGYNMVRKARERDAASDNHRDGDCPMLEPSGDACNSQSQQNCEYCAESLYVGDES